MRIRDQVAPHRLKVVAGHEKRQTRVADAGNIKRGATVQDRKAVRDIVERGGDFGLALNLPFGSDRPGETRIPVDQPRHALDLAFEQGRIDRPAQAVFHDGERMVDVMGDLADVFPGTVDQHRVLLQQSIHPVDEALQFPGVRSLDRLGGTVFIVVHGTCDPAEIAPQRENDNRQHAKNGERNRNQRQHEQIAQTRRVLGDIVFVLFGAHAHQVMHPDRRRPAVVGTEWRHFIDNAFGDAHRPERGRDVGDGKLRRRCGHAGFQPGPRQAEQRRPVDHLVTLRYLPYPADIGTAEHRVRGRDPVRAGPSAAGLATGPVAAQLVGKLDQPCVDNLARHFARGRAEQGPEHQDTGGEKQQRPERNPADKRCRQRHKTRHSASGGSGTSASR